MSGKDGNKPPIHHIFDGIEEQDNHMPNWWLLILWATIIFAFGYWYYYHSAGMGPLQWEAYQAEVDEQTRKAASSQPLSDELLLSFSKNGGMLQEGQQQFQQQCASCHGAQGQGLIGPNLTDDFWLHGGKPMQLHKAVSEGIVAKGMPAWGRTLGAERVKAVVAYVLTLKNTNVPGKPPQGEPEQ